MEDFITIKDNKDIKDNKEDTSIFYDIFVFIYKIYSLKKFILFPLGNILHFLCQTVGFVIFLGVVHSYGSVSDVLNFAVVIYAFYFLAVRFIFEILFLGFSINNKLEKIVNLMEENKNSKK